MTASVPPEVPDEVAKQLAERRADREFTDRLSTRMTEDAALLNRLDGCSEPLHLVGSHGGGSALLYECPSCGAKVARTREQAERDAL